LVNIRTSAFTFELGRAPARRSRVSSADVDLREPRHFHTLGEAKAVALELVTLDALFTDAA